MCRLAFVAFACLALGQASAEALQPAADDPRLNAALAALKPQRPGTVDAYVIVAALDTDPVFNREAREAGRVLAERFGAEGRVITLAEDEGDDQAAAAGTPADLAAALARTGALMDRNEDVLVLYTTSHGSPHSGLSYNNDARGRGVIRPQDLTAMLAGNGAQNRLIMLQACFSGQFVPALAGPRSVVVTAASSMKSSFGCSASNDWTFFGHALINQAMRTSDTLVRQVRRAFVLIIGWEQKLGIESSNPQVSVGAETGPWLAALDVEALPVPQTPVGKPPSELEN